MTGQRHQGKTSQRKITNRTASIVKTLQGVNVNILWLNAGENMHASFNVCSVRYHDRLSREKPWRETEKNRFSSTTRRAKQMKSPGATRTTCSGMLMTRQREACMYDSCNCQTTTAWTTLCCLQLFKFLGLPCLCKKNSCILRNDCLLEQSGLR